MTKYAVVVTSLDSYGLAFAYDFGAGRREWPLLREDAAHAETFDNLYIDDGGSE